MPLSIYSSSEQDLNPFLVMTKTSGLSGTKCSMSLFSKSTYIWSVSNLVLNCENTSFSSFVLISLPLSNSSFSLAYCRIKCLILNFFGIINSFNVLKMFIGLWVLLLVDNLQIDEQM